MRLHVKLLALFLSVLLIAACATGGRPVEHLNDGVPMYGRGQLQDDPGLHAEQARLNEELVPRYGSREAAGRHLLEQGIRQFQIGDYLSAMQRFNQAWLLDPSSPDPYWGFAMIYDDQGKSCLAKAMIDRAIRLNLSRPMALADAGRIYTYCAVTDAALSAMDKQNDFEHAEDFYSRAVSLDPTDPKLFGSWAIAQYWQGHYADAWKMINKQRLLGGAPGEDFLVLLRAEMTEPRH